MNQTTYTIHRATDHNGIRRQSVSINGQSSGWAIESWDQSDGRWYGPMEIDGYQPRIAFKTQREAVDYIVACAA